MAFSKADGTAGAFNEDGSVAGAAFKGAISAGTNSNVDGNVFDIKANVPDDPNLPPVPEGVNNVAPHAGTWNNLDSATVMALGSDFAKTASANPGADGSNNTDTSSDVVSDSNYKTLIRAGISPGDPDWDSSFAVVEKGVWDNLGLTDTASSMKNAQSDQANVNLVVAGAQSPVTYFITVPSNVGPDGRTSGRCYCEYVPQSRQVPAYRKCCSPFETHSRLPAGSVSLTFCTGTVAYQWEVGDTKQPKRPLNCTQKGGRQEPATLWLGYSASMKTSGGHLGRCFIKEDITFKSLAGVVLPGVVGCDPPDLAEAFNCESVCGEWSYMAVPIDEFGDIVGGTKRIYESEFTPYQQISLACPDFTEAYYRAQVALMPDPPPYMDYDCALPGTPPVVRPANPDC